MACLTIQSLLSQTVPLKGLVVIDNSNANRVLGAFAFSAQAEWATQLGVSFRYVAAPPLGIVGAHCLAEEEALRCEGEMVLHADDDMWYPPRFVERVLGACSDIVGALCYFGMSDPPAAPYTDVAQAYLHERYFLGGAFAYHRRLAGLWPEVRKHTQGLYDDLAWQLYAEEKGGGTQERLPATPEYTVVHYARFHPARYDGAHGEFIRSVRQAAAEFHRGAQCQ